MPDDNEQPVFTIGHSNHALSEFLSLLEDHDIKVLVDVRSSPYSRFAPHFTKTPLHEAVTAAGMRYLYLGRELGGRPEEAEYYDHEGYVLYDRLAGSPRFRDGIRLLRDAARRYRVAMMCAEEDPTHCHRRLLVARVLEKEGIDVRHIRADGRVQSEEQVAREEELSSGATRQPSLFDTERYVEWKSPHPVKRPEPPPEK